MKNNRGFGKFEVLTVMVVLLAVFAFLAYRFLGGTSIKKINTMKDDANNFAKLVVVHKDSFHNARIVYLGEVIDEKYMKEIKNPAGSGNCSHSESFVSETDDRSTVTLLCGEYLIDNANIDNLKDATIYKVGPWTETKTNDDDEERDFFNCKENGKNIFDEDYEEYYFVYQYNQKYDTNHYFVTSINRGCEIVKTTKYRTREELK